MFPAPPIQQHIAVVKRDVAANTYLLQGEEYHGEQRKQDKWVGD
jgi:hypothetical protein